MTNPPQTVYGVDFGVGSTDAGRSTWVARLDATGDRPHVAACRPLVELLDCDPSREAALPALADWLAALDGAAVGLDFPFGLPVEILPSHVDDWRGFLAWVAAERDGVFADPDALSAWGTDRARTVTDGERTYLPRQTDHETDAQCVYGFIGKYPTLYGLRDLLVPLVHGPPTPRVTVAPVMDHPPETDHPSDATRPLVLETYPAAIHETRAIHRESYKESTDAARERRLANRDALLTDVNATASDAVRRRVGDDADGDALDALAAAVAAYANTRDVAGLAPGDVTDRERVEARIYR